MSVRGNHHPCVSRSCKTLRIYQDDIVLSHTGFSRLISTGGFKAETLAFSSSDVRRTSRDGFQRDRWHLMGLPEGGHAHMPDADLDVMLRALHRRHCACGHPSHTGFKEVINTISMQIRYH